MFVLVYPESPSAALTAAVIEAGAQPVPIADLDAVADRSPSGGWSAAVVEATEDVGRCLAVASKLTSSLDIPVLLVIDRTATRDIAGEEGFTDFVLSPIDRREFAVRLARVADNDGASTDADVLRHRDLELNTATYQATVGGLPRDLTYMEYELLRFFVEHPGRAWSREQILSKVWGYDYFGGSRTVDVHVRRLRAKLGEERSSWITTVRSVGYRFG